MQGDGKRGWGGGREEDGKRGWGGGREGDGKRGWGGGREGDGKTHLSGCAQTSADDGKQSRVSETLDTDKISVRQQVHAFLPDPEGRGAAAQTFPPQKTPAHSQPLDARHAVWPGEPVTGGTSAVICIQALVLYAS